MQSPESVLLLPFTEDGFQTIVADPPWVLPKTTMGAGGRRSRATDVPYSFMGLDDIMAMPVESIAAENALLFLWSTRKVFREGDAARVARAWGFEPYAETIWGLRNPGMGSGSVGNDHEPVLIARRGNAKVAGVDGFVGVHFWRQLYVNGGKVHSAKPEAFLDFVEQISEGPRVELFSRRERMGWKSWGDQSINGDEAA